jgi:NAD(P)H-dependent FMN reductase
MVPLTISILYGSLRRDRTGIRVVRFLDAALRRRGHAVTVVDAAEKNLPLLDRMYKEYPEGAAPSVLEELAQLYRRADGFLIVAGEYNHGIQPGLSNLLDHFLEEYFFRPSAIACYSAGAFGGVRAAMALRMTLAELGMPSIPSLLPVPRVTEAFDADGSPRDPAWEQRSEKFFAEFEWYARALKAQRRRGLPY